MIRSWLHRQWQRMYKIQSDYFSREPYQARPPLQKMTSPEV